MAPPRACRRAPSEGVCVSVWVLSHLWELSESVGIEWPTLTYTRGHGHAHHACTTRNIYMAPATVNFAHTAIALRSAP